MRKQTPYGKGDCPREVDGERYRENWNAIFGPKSGDEEEQEENED